MGPPSYMRSIVDRNVVMRRAGRTHTPYTVVRCLGSSGSAQLFTYQPKGILLDNCAQTNKTVALGCIRAILSCTHGTHSGSWMKAA